MSGADSGENGRWIRSVVERFEGKLLRYAAQLTGDGDRAGDVVQETFLRLCREDREKIEGHLAEWLYTVCRSRALDLLRKEKRMSTVSDAAASRPSREPPQAEVAADRDSFAQIQRLIERLPDNQREVVRLKYQNDLSYREIASITELSVSNVGYLLHTALKTIRGQMEEGKER